MNRIHRLQIHWFFGSLCVLISVAMTHQAKAQPDVIRWAMLFDDRCQFADFQSFLADHPESLKPDTPWILRDAIEGLDDLELSLSPWEELEALEAEVMGLLTADGHWRWQQLEVLRDLHGQETVEAAREAGLPSSYGWLPALLTGFDHSYQGPGDRAGLWALPFGEARAAGLRVDGTVDERMIPEACTEAALAVLARMRLTFPDDELRTLVAYARGVAFARQWSGIPGDAPQLDAWLSLYRVVARITANVEPEPHGWNWLETLSKWEAVDSPVDTLHREALEEVLGMNRRLQRTLIPWWTGPTVDLATWRTYGAALPIGWAEKWRADSLALTAWTPKDWGDYSQRHTHFHTIQSGEVLGIIARKYGVTVREIQAWNNLKSDRIRVGQSLAIHGYFGDKPAPTSAPKKGAAWAGGRFQSYTVKAGDTLWEIAEQYPGVSSEDLMSLNGISSGLQVGQRIKIPLR